MLMVSRQTFVITILVLKTGIICSSLLDVQPFFFKGPVSPKFPVLKYKQSLTQKEALTCMKRIPRFICIYIGRTLLNMCGD